jgi:sugar-phosphatase
MSVFNKRYAAFFFDMDGTLTNSLVSAERVWGRWAASQGLNVPEFLPTIHGRRTIDTISALGIPGLDAEAESRKITEGEIEDLEGVVEIAGARHFLESLKGARWAIVTSAPRALAEARVRAAHLPNPPLIVASEDVRAGKPNPAPYLLAAEKLGVKISDCLIFEDAPAGIAAAKASGADLLVITATHHSHPLETDGEDPAMENYENLKAHILEDGGLELISS